MSISMHSILKLFLLTGALCSGLLPAIAQPAKRAKPAVRKAAEEKPRAAEKSDEEVSEQQMQEASELFEKGQSLHQQGNLEEAVQLYTEALAKDESLWQAEFQRSLALLALDRLPEAREGIERVQELLQQISDSPELTNVRARVQTARGEILNAQGHFAEAETAFRQALAFNPDGIRAEAGLAQIYFAGGKLKEAAASADKVIRAGDKRAVNYLVLGAALAGLQKYPEAIASLNEALRAEPQNTAALSYRAEAHIARKNFEQAVTDLQAIIAIEKKTAILLRLAQVFMQMSKNDEAVRIAQEIIEREPGNTAAQNLLTAASVDSADERKAIEQLEKLTEAEPKRADLRAQLADRFLITQPDKALEHYRMAAELEPTNWKHFIGYGASLLKLRRFPEAAGLMRQMLARNPVGEVAYFAHTNLATSLFELKNYQHAAAEYQWIISHQPDPKKQAVAIFFLGVCLDRMGEFDRALTTYQNFLQIAPPENSLEIEKVKLRLEPLKRQIEKSGNRQKKK